jgi:lipase chaperone LimK
MKFSLLSFATLSFVTAFTIFIVNIFDLNGSDTKNESLSINQKEILSPQSITQPAPSEIDNLNILELNTFRFTSVDGAIKVDKHNHLIIDEDLRHWLDFYLSAIGEIDINKITLLMEKEIDTLPSPGKEQAHNIMNQYLAYKRELAQYENQELRSMDGNHDIEQLSNRLDWQMRLRRQHLDDNVVESFWKKDEIIDSYALEKLKIRNSDISEADKEEQLEALENSLPEELYSFKQELYIASNLLEKELAESSNPTELRNLRIEEVGIEAADRLAEVDKSQQEWQLKVLAYRNEVQKISESEGISNIDKEELISEYREENFSSTEVLRLKAAVQLLSDTQ